MTWASARAGEGGRGEDTMAAVARLADLVLELVDKAAHDGACPRLSVQREAVDVGAADEHRVRTEGQGLEGVAARADPGVEEHGHLVADRPGDRSQRVERGDRSVDLAAAVVGDDDSVDLVPDRKPGVVWALDPLEQDRAVPVR